MTSHPLVLSIKYLLPEPSCDTQSILEKQQKLADNNQSTSLNQFILWVTHVESRISQKPKMTAIVWCPSIYSH